ncbi:cation:proton antiporter regulatory subunit [Pengzhenrongella frigida]|uniref:Potassium transporter TrkA n=1 Tax=Pengzhenrongella frigida TaxID=1259133 RepID=A0A4Q5N441_9MICO|nr:cation:proton antiporter regulatory subunit [Cellulomonas sp. HLT2-17]RYV52946.1 potassium transporter TrkA [Cellulomonas sp. HLT2-17]
MDVTEILLPGVGVRYEFDTEAGMRMGVVAHRDGRFEFVRYGRADPDAALPVAMFSREEADTVAEILGAPRITERFADLTREIPGLAAATVAVPVGSRFAGKTLGATRARTLTGASVVAIVRGDGVIASPIPSEILLGDDALVVIGTDTAIDGVRRIVSG